MPAPGSIQQQDTLVTPVVTQLKVLTEQIAGIDTIYVDPPDHAPADNSVVFLLRDFQVVNEANGLYTVELVFEIDHLFTRTNLSRATARAYAALPAWLEALTAWQNQSLGGTAQQITLERQNGSSIRGVKWSNTPYLAVSTRVAVMVELPINDN